MAKKKKSARNQRTTPKPSWPDRKQKRQSHASHFSGVSSKEDLQTKNIVQLLAQPHPEGGSTLSPVQPSLCKSARKPTKKKKKKEEN